MKDPIAELVMQQSEVDNLQALLNRATRKRNDLVKELYKDGATIAELSRAALISRNTIYKIVNR